MASTRAHAAATATMQRPSPLLSLLSFLLVTGCLCLLVVASPQGKSVAQLSTTDIPWSSLTPSQVANLTQAQLQNCTAEDLALIPGDSCRGLQDFQVDVLTTQCAGLTAACAGNMSLSAVGAFTSDCSVAWSSWTTVAFAAEQVSRFSADVFMALDADALSGFSASCGGLSPEDVEALAQGVSKYPTTGNVCLGLLPQCVAAAPDDAFAFLQPACSVNMGASAWGALRSVQVELMNPSVFAAMVAAQVLALEPTGCAGLQPAQLAALPDLGPSLPWWLGQHLCASLTATCVAAISARTLATVSGDCGGDFNANAFPLFSAEQVAALSYNVTASLTAAQLATLGPTQCAALSSRQVSGFGKYTAPYDACSGLRADCLAALDTRAWVGVEPPCFVMIPPPSLETLSAEQVGSWPPADAAVLSATQLVSLSPQACSGIEGGQISFFGTNPPYDTCTGLNAACAEQLKPQTLASLTSVCVVQADPAVLGQALSLAQVASIAPASLEQLDPITVTGWVSRFGNDVVTTLSPAAIVMPKQALSTSRLFAPPTPPSPSPVVHESRTGEELSDAAILGVKQAVYTGALVPNFTLSLPLTSITSLQLAFCTPECMKLLLASSIPAPLVLPNVLSLPPRSYRGLRSDQVSQLSPDIIALFGARNLGALMSDAVSALSVAQLAVLPASSVASLDLRALSVSSGAVASLTPGQIESIPYAQWDAEWSCAQWNNMSSPQRGAMDSTAAASFSTECSGGGSQPKPPPVPVIPGDGDGDKGFATLTIFIISVAAAAIGGLLLSALAYVCFLRPSWVQTVAAAKASFSAGGETEESYSSSTDRRRRGLAGGSARLHAQAGGAFNRDSPLGSSLRQPLHPGGGGGGAGPLTPTGIGQRSPAPMTYPAVDDDDEEFDIAGSRF